MRKKKRVFARKTSMLDENQCLRIECAGDRYELRYAICEYIRFLISLAGWRAVLEDVMTEMVQKRFRDAHWRELPERTCARLTGSVVTRIFINVA